MVRHDVVPLFSERLMAQVKQWSRFGWHGVTFDVPADWDLRQFHGTRRKGYAQLCDPDVVRLELRWERPKRAPEFGALADRVIAQTAKDGKLEIERDTRLAELDGKDCETFTCRPGPGGGASSYNLVSLCRACGRVVMLRVLFLPGENVKAIATRVLGSVQDHSYDGADVWAAYGIEFAVPDTLELDDALIYPGSLDFRFLSRNDRVAVGRLALGSAILGKMPLAEWFRTFARKRFKNISYTEEEAEVHGHPGLIARGRLKGLGALVPRLVRRQRFLCRLWHCDVSDRLHFFAVLASERNYDRFAAYGDRVVCD